MSSVLLIMWRRMIAGSLLADLSKELGLLLYYEPDYAHAAESMRKHDAKVAQVVTFEKKLPTTGRADKNKYQYNYKNERSNNHGTYKSRAGGSRRRNGRPMEGVFLLRVASG